MSTRQIDRPLEADALAEIESAVHGKLKAYNLSESFIERCIEDAVQKGLVEYFRTLRKGEIVENRNGQWRVSGRPLRPRSLAPARIEQLVAHQR